MYLCGEYLDGDIYPVFQPPGKRRKKCRPTSAIQARLWEHGYANSKRLQFTDEGVAGLTHYIVKDRHFYKRWSGSRNLIRPEPAQIDGQMSMFDVEEAADAIENGRAHAWFESRWPDFELVSATCTRNGINRGVYIHFEMRKRRERSVMLRDA